MKRMFVFLALIGLLLPAVRSVAVAAHLLLEHDHASTSRAAAELVAAFHGHDHESGTPSHDHPVTLQVSSTSTAPALVIAVTAVTAASTAPEAPIGPLFLRRTAAREGPPTSNADPPAPESLSVFRI